MYFVEFYNPGNSRYFMYRYKFTLLGNVHKFLYEDTFGAIQKWTSRQLGLQDPQAKSKLINKSSAKKK